jgi:hypothetical protein
MKMRMQGNAIRFRLNRKEGAEFAVAGQILESMEFAPAGDRRLVCRGARRGCSWCEKPICDGLSGSRTSERRQPLRH